MGHCAESFQVVVKSSVLSSSQQINSAPAAIFTSNSSSSSTGSSQTPPNTLQPNSILTPGQPPPQNVLGRPGIQLYVSVYYCRGIKLVKVSKDDELRHSSSVFFPCCPPPPKAVPWFVNELGEAVAMAPPPPYSYDPNGSDLPRGQRKTPPCLIISFIFVLFLNSFFSQIAKCSSTTTIWGFR